MQLLLLKNLLIQLDSMASGMGLIDYCQGMGLVPRRTTLVGSQVGPNAKCAAHNNLLGWQAVWKEWKGNRAMHQGALTAVPALACRVHAPKWAHT